MFRVEKFLTKSYKAFTLAEVLITLAILGVIATMILPSINKSLEQEFITGVKEANVILSSALKKAAVSQGFIEPSMIIKNTDDTTELIDTLCEQMSCRHKCYQQWSSKYDENNTVVPYCFPPSVKNKNGDVKYGHVNLYQSEFWITKNYAEGGMILNNGMSIIVARRQRMLCENDSVSAPYSAMFLNSFVKGCALFIVDVNGFKGPNKVGDDVHEFVLTKKGLKTIDDYYVNANHYNQGFDCARKMLLGQSCD